MRIKGVMTAVLAIASICATAADCQIVYNQPGTSALRFNYSDWTLSPESGDETISQMTLGLSGFLPLRDNFEARYQLMSGYNNLGYAGEETDITGLGDLRLLLSHSFSDDRLLLSAGLNLPTGKRELDTDGERQIIEFLSQDFLSLPMRRYGEGLGFNLQAGGAAVLGPFKCGAGVVYDYCGSFKPYDGVGDYDPGDVLSLTATAAAEAGRMAYTGDFGFSFFTTDALDGEEIYRQAPQFSTRLAATLSGDRISWSAGTRVILRGRNKRYSLADGAIDSQLKKYGDEYDVFLRAAFPLGDSWNLGTMAGTRQILESEEELGSSSILNFAVDLGGNLTSRLGLDLGFMYYTGSADGGDVDIDGFQASGGLRVSY